MKQIDFQKNFNKLLRKAEEQNNYNAYGWLMIYMQIEEDFYLLRKERNKVFLHIERIEEELTKQTCNKVE